MHRSLGIFAVEFHVQTVEGGNGTTYEGARNMKLKTENVYRSQKCCKMLYTDNDGINRNREVSDGNLTHQVLYIELVFNIKARIVPLIAAFPLPNVLQPQGR
jgi:hypothetical protein